MWYFPMQCRAWTETYWSFLRIYPFFGRGGGILIPPFNQLLSVMKCRFISSQSSKLKTYGYNINNRNENCNLHAFVIKVFVRKPMNVLQSFYAFHCSHICKCTILPYVVHLTIGFHSVQHTYFGQGAKIYIWILMYDFTVFHIQDTHRLFSR